MEHRAVLVRSALARLSPAREDPTLCSRSSGPEGVWWAKADAAWDAAYGRATSIEVRDDLKRALRTNPQASKAFAGLDKANRYSVLYRVTTARRPDTRARRVERLVDMLAQGHVIYPEPKGRRARLW